MLIIFNTISVKKQFILIYKRSFGMMFGLIQNIIGSLVN